MTINKLENRCAFTGTEGSNPSLSAICVNDLDNINNFVQIPRPADLHTLAIEALC